ncbi:universal stress protein (plasmid) [Haloferacaceae archaeon DSL9]
MVDRPEVLVAVSNPSHAEQLVRTAGDLARATDAGIRIVTVVVKSHDSPFSVFDDETIARKFSGDRRQLLDRATAVAPDDVPVEAELVVAGSVSRGVLQATAAADPIALLVGWQGPPSRTDAVLGTEVDALLQRAPCDVYVERIGRLADGVDSILLPVAGGPHVRPAAAVAKAIAAANDASVTLLSLATPDHDRGAAVEAVDAARTALAEAPGGDVAVEAAIRTTDDIEDTLAEAADAHDIVVFGTTRRSAFHRRLVGSVPRRVTDRTDTTIILARAPDKLDSQLRSALERLRRSR